jgi:hypothetical protein
MLAPRNPNPAPTNNIATKLIIPASATDLTHIAAQDVTHIKEVIFAPGSTIQQLKAEDFAGFISLRSIQIAASITVIESYCFTRKSSAPGPDQSTFQLTRLMFEPGSKLRTIEPYAFWGCHSLERIELPPSLETVSLESFAGCGLCQIEIDSNNQCLASVKGLLISRQDDSVIGYLGDNDTEEVEVPAYIKILGELSFAELDSLKRIHFGTGSEIRSIRAGAFRFCSHLELI